MKISLHIDAYFDTEGENANTTHWYMDSYRDTSSQTPRVIVAAGQQPTPLEALDAIRATMRAKMGLEPEQLTESLGRPVQAINPGKSPADVVPPYIQRRKERQAEAQAKFEF